MANLSRKQRTKTLNTMPRHLYVFTKKEYLDGLLKEGTIRVGTLAEYRKDDGTTGAKNDENEGSAFWQPKGEIQVTPDHPILKHMIHPASGTFSMEGGAYVRIPTNHNLLCLAKAISTSMIKRMKKDFGSNSCYRIDNPIDFFLDITDAIPELEEPISARPVKYVYKRPVAVDHLARDLFIDPYLKPWEYGWQREYRIVWPTIDPDNVKPYLVNVPSLAGYIKPIDISKI